MIFAVIIGLVSGLLFGIATPLSKLLLTKMNSFQLAGLLYIGAMTAFSPYIAIHYKREINSIKKANQKWAILGIIVFGGFLGPLLLMFGLETSSASSVSIWLNMELVATALLGVLLFKDHLDLPAIIGVGLSLAAGIIVTFQEGGSAILSVLLITAACFCWGVDNHLTALIDGASPQTITFIKGLFAGSTNLVIGSVMNSQYLSVGTLLTALLVGALSYGVSIVFYVTAAQQLGATRSQILFSTGPFWGVLVSFIFLAEPINAYVIVAMVLLIAGIISTNILAHKHTHHHPRTVHTHLHTHGDGHHGHIHEQKGNAAIRHTHLHTHEEQRHSHKHYPDLHHRHTH